MSLQAAQKRFNISGSAVMVPAVVGANGNGPLSGLTVGMKANIAVAGHIHSAGMAHRSSIIAKNHASITMRLLEQGADLVPHLNMDEAALGGLTDNVHFGRTDNPRLPGYNAGGSSGGSAAAVAAGCVDAALGTDTLGSIRIPASWCGVAGLKPTHGLVGRTGIVPLALGLDVVGPMARTAEQLLPLLDCLAGFDRDDPDSLPLPDDWHTKEAKLSMRIGVPVEIGGVDCEPETLTALTMVRKALMFCGHDVVAISVPGWSPPDLRRAAFLVLEAEGAVALAEDLARGDTFSPDVRKLLMYGHDVPAVKLTTAMMVLARARAGFARTFLDVDCLLMPTTPQRATLADTAAPANQADFTAPANIAGLPAIAVPVELPNADRPASVQLMGPAWSDRWLIACAVKLEQALAKAA
ncbi:amidase [Ahrensia sp. R2A130]|uniref:amidase n=1 Tax=Ahrensia sp. R2A130 TaxID=744979 RepID=UPI0001E0E111|nr:amidase [Ahrensia sp. R2A130]EFL87552.1 glutamyl-tRNA(Gln) amidotransferase subunit A [Ahrensia sp. R2A130]